MPTVKIPVRLSIAIEGGALSPPNCLTSMNVFLLALQIILDKYCLSNFQRFLVLFVLLLYDSYFPLLN